MGNGINAGRLEIRLVLLQGIAEISPLVSAGNEEIGEVGDIVGTDVTVGNDARAAVANVVGGLNVVLIDRVRIRLRRWSRRSGVVDPRSGRSSGTVDPELPLTRVPYRAVKSFQC
jgi:hypothetical protein